MAASEGISSRAQDRIGLREAAIRALACLASFVTIGCAPLATYAYSSGFGDDAARAFCVLVFFVFLLGVAVLRVAASGESRAGAAIVETMVLGGSAGAIAYGIASI